MRLTTNEKLIERQSRIARYATFGGLGLLLASLVTSFRGEFIGVAYGALFAGFVLAYIGSVLSNKWVKQPRPDQVLVKALKGLDNKNHLYNYLLPAPHVLLTSSGILVFKPKPHNGAITCKDGRWHRPWRWSRLLGGMGQEPLGDPIAELNADIGKIRALLADKIETAALVPIDGYVVFTDPLVQLSLDDPNLPVLMADDLKDTLRKSKRSSALSPELLEKVERILNNEADAKAAK
jgi:hypothetical protein